MFDFVQPRAVLGNRVALLGVTGLNKAGVGCGKGTRGPFVNKVAPPLATSSATSHRRSLQSVLLNEVAHHSFRCLGPITISHTLAVGS